MRRRTTDRKRVLIVGGGFAGLAATLGLCPDRHQVTLFNRSRWFEFLPNIHELLSGVKTPELLRLPLDEIVQRAGHTFRCDTVTAIDPVARTIRTHRRRTPIGYDALIVAIGGVNATRGIPGVSEHALPFKSVEQCHRIGRRLTQLDRRRKPARVVIVGGGLEGVEALGEILRVHRKSQLHVTLVDARERLLSEAPAELDPHLRKLCAPYQVDFKMNSRVQSVDPERVVLEGGKSLPSDLTIWTGGPAPPLLLEEGGLAAPGSWASVAPTLQAKAHREIFVLGDAAKLPKPVSQQAYHALDMGACAAENAERLFKNRRLHPFRPSGKPTLISFGDLSCFMVIGRRVIAGAALAGAKEAVFELVMARLDAQSAACRASRIAKRADRAGRELLWPNVSSLEGLRRQGRVELLASQ